MITQSRCKTPEPTLSIAFSMAGQPARTICLQTRPAPRIHWVGAMILAAIRSSGPIVQARRWRRVLRQLSPLSARRHHQPSRRRLPGNRLFTWVGLISARTRLEIVLRCCLRRWQPVLQPYPRSLPPFRGLPQAVLMITQSRCKTPEPTLSIAFGMAGQPAGTICLQTRPAPRIHWVGAMILAAIRSSGPIVQARRWRRVLRQLSPLSARRHHQPSRRRLPGNRLFTWVGLISARTRLEIVLRCCLRHW